MNKTQTDAPLTSKIARPLTKGCGCVSIFFFIFFIWGIWTTITTYSHIVEVNATVVDFVQQENVFADARFSENQIPVITYNFEGNTYLDTINYSIDYSKDWSIGSVNKVFISPEQPQFSMENSTNTFYFYSIFLVLAIISFGIYKLFKTRVPKLAENSTQLSAASLNKNTSITKEVVNKISPPTKEQTHISLKNLSQGQIRQAPPWLSIAIAVILVLVGLGMGYYKFTRTQTASFLKEKGVRTKGIVTFVDRGKTQDIKRKDLYTISYFWNDVPYKYKTQLSFAHYNMNEELMLLVNPDSPSQAMLASIEDSEKGSYLFALFLIVMGIAIIYYQKNYHNQRENKP